MGRAIISLGFGPKARLLSRPAIFTGEFWLVVVARDVDARLKTPTDRIGQTKSSQQQQTRQTHKQRELNSHAPYGRDQNRLGKPELLACEAPIGATGLHWTRASRSSSQAAGLAHKRELSGTQTRRALVYLSGPKNSNFIWIQLDSIGWIHNSAAAAAAATTRQMIDQLDSAAPMAGWLAGSVATAASARLLHWLEYGERDV